MTKKIEKSESVRVVTDNRFITANGLESLTLKERKLLYLAIAQVKMKDEEFYLYSLTAKEFADIMGISVKHIYQEAETITENLRKVGIRCEVTEDGEQETRVYNLFSYIQYSKRSISFKLNPDMTEFLLQLSKNFTKPLLDDFMKMKSPYSIALWHLFQREMHSRKPSVFDSIEFELSLEEMRQVTGTQETFEKISDFKRYVLDQAIKDIKNTAAVVITYEPVKKSRTIIGYKFHAEAEFHLEDTLPEYKKEEIRKRADELHERIRQKQSN